ncbi:MAG: DUF6340 family protein, partial [Myxococcota bacterium]
LADKEARLDAGDEVTAMLDSSPRYTAIPGPSDLDETSIWDKGLTRQTVAELADRYDVDAVLALEAFDSDSDVIDVGALARAESSEDVAEEVAWYILERRTEVLTSFRVYDADGDVIDGLREYRAGNVFDAEGETLEATLAGLPDGRSVVRGLALDASRDYAGRVAPLWETVDRPLYRGHPALEAGNDAAMSGNAALARESWESLVSGVDQEVAAQACFNLAVLAESEGELAMALDLATLSVDKSWSGRADTYVSELQALVEANGERLQR